MYRSVEGTFCLFDDAACTPIDGSGNGDVFTTKGPARVVSDVRLPKDTAELGKNVRLVWVMIMLPWFG